MEFLDRIFKKGNITEEVSLTLDDMTVEDAREFLKKLGDALDERP